MTQIQAIFIKNLKKIRTESGLSQILFSEKIGVSAGFVAELETGNRAPSIQTIQQIADAFKLKPYQLFLDEDDIEDFNKSDLIRSIKKEMKNQFPEFLDKVIKKYSP
jgi:transcriptional regulator with XRE-family HTH domain